MFMLGCLGSLLPCVGSLGCGSGGCSDAGRGLPIAEASLVSEHRLWGSPAQQLWRGGLAVPRHAGSSRSWNGTHVPSIGSGLPTTGPPQNPCSGFCFTLTSFPSPVTSETEPSSQTFACPLRSFYLKTSWRFMFVASFSLPCCLRAFLVAQLLRIRLQCGRPGFDTWVGKIPWRRESLPTLVFWPGEVHGLYSP